VSIVFPYKISIFSLVSVYHYLK